MRQPQIAPSSFGKQREREKVSRGMVMATQNTPRLWRSSRMASQVVWRDFVQ